MAVTRSYTKYGSDFITRHADDMAGLPNGGFIIVGPSGDDIGAQIYNRFGTRVGADFIVNTKTANQQDSAAVATLANGNFVVTWVDSTGDSNLSGIKAQIFTSAGAKVGTEFLVNTTTTGQQFTPNVVGLPNDNFAVIWEDRSSGIFNPDIRAQIFSASGTKAGSEILVNTQTAGSQYHPQIAALLTGHFAVVWEDGSGTLGDASGSSIKAQVFDPNGAKVRSELLLNSAVQDDQTMPSLLASEDGFFLASWSSPWTFMNSAAADIKARAFSFGGEAIGDAELTINTQKSDGQISPVGSDLQNGRFVLAWTDFGPPSDTSAPNIKYSVYNGSGFEPEAFAAQTEEDEIDPRITDLSDDGFVVSWLYNHSTRKAQQFQPVLSGDGTDDGVAAPAGPSIINLGGGIDTVTFGFALASATVTYRNNTVVISNANTQATITGAEKFVFTDGTVDNADGDRLVDDLYYYSRNLDVWNAKADADSHFHNFGWQEGRDPSALFDVSFYRSVYQDVRSSGVDPLAHFDSVGWKEGRMPSEAFDAAAYLKKNPDVAAAGIDPLRHYLQNGYDEGRVPIAGELIAPNGFDYGYYLENNPDVAAAGIDPFAHFQNFGWKEGRKPNSTFDTKGYLANYTDVAAIGANPLDHYHNFGWKEGRDPIVTFDTTSYLDAYPDVKTIGIDPLVHFLDFGVHEGRQSFGDGMWG